MNKRRRIFCDTNDSNLDITSFRSPVRQELHCLSNEATILRPHNVLKIV